MRALQWDIRTVPPSDIVKLVAVDGILRGYGYGPGTSMMFGTPMGDITVENGQWVVVDDERFITVLDECGMARVSTEGADVYIDTCTLPEGHDGGHNWPGEDA